MNNRTFYVIQVSGRCGVINQTGSLTVKPEYEDISRFTEDLASYCVNGKHGLMDGNGNIIAPPRFEGIHVFSEGLAVYEEGLQFGYLDRKGNLVVPAELSNAGTFSQGLTAVQFSPTGLEGYINGTGQVVIDCQFLSAGDFSEGLAHVLTGSKPVRFGFINSTGNLVIAPNFGCANSFSEGLAVVSKKEKPGKFGVIDAQGEWVQQPWFEAADAVFSEGLCPIWRNRKFGFIDCAGEIRIPCRSEDVGSFLDGLCRATFLVRSRTKEDFIDREGEWAIPPVFDWVEDFEGPLAGVWLGDKRGYINRSGEYVWEPTE